jgi:tetratricopeptide (TPR) repeat protein
MNGRLLFVAFLVSVAASAAVSYWLGTRDDSSAAARVSTEQFARLAERTTALEDALTKSGHAADDLRRRLTAAEERLTRAETPASGVARGPGSPEAAAAESAAGATGGRPAAGAPLDLASALTLLADQNLDDVARAELWKKIAKAGLLDAVLADLEAKAKADKQNPAAQVAYAEACIAKIQEVGQSPLAGVYGNRADKAYDAALAADPEHWEARFGKAIALSFWPPIMGKQPEAIRQFETLIAQQEKRQPAPEYAQTYLLLGNLLAQSGKADQAREIWQKGATLYPDHAGLKDRLGANR